MEDALKALIESYGNELYRFCLRLAINQADAEDLYQDTFLTAMEHRERLMSICEKECSQSENNRKNRNFLMGIATNLWRNQYRKQVRDRKNISFESEEGQKLQLTGSGGADEDFEQQEIQERLNLYVNALPEKLRAVVFLFYAADMSDLEISKALHIPRGTVKSRLYLARKKIKKSLEADGYEI